MEGVVQVSGWQAGLSTRRPDPGPAGEAVNPACRREPPMAPRAHPGSGTRDPGLAGARSAGRRAARARPPPAPGGKSSKWRGGRGPESTGAAFEKGARGFRVSATPFRVHRDRAGPPPPTGTSLLLVTFQVPGLHQVPSASRPSPPPPPPPPRNPPADPGLPRADCPRGSSPSRTRPVPIPSPSRNRHGRFRSRLRAAGGRRVLSLTPNFAGHQDTGTS